MENENNPEQQSIKLEQLTSKRFPSFDAQIETQDYVTRFRTLISGYLAVGLWSALVLCCAWHAVSVGRISSKMLNYEESLTSIEDKDYEPDLERYDKAFIMVGDTAKTLYAVLSPLATAATGFYFVVKTGFSSRGES